MRTNSKKKPLVIEAKILSLELIARSAFILIKIINKKIS